MIIFLMLSIALHELAHAAAAWFFHVRVKGTRVQWFGVAIVRERRGGWKGAAICMAGPLASLFVAGVCTGFAREFNAAMFLVSVMPLRCSDGFHAWEALFPYPVPSSWYPEQARGT